MGTVKEIAKDLEFWKHHGKKKEAPAEIKQQPPLSDSASLTKPGVKIIKERIPPEALDSRRFVTIKTDKGETITGKIQSIDKDGNITLKVNTHGIKKLAGFKTKPLHIKAESITGIGVGKTAQEAQANVKSLFGLNAPVISAPPAPKEEEVPTFTQGTTAAKKPKPAVVPAPAPAQKSRPSTQKTIKPPEKKTGEQKPKQSAPKSNLKATVPKPVKKNEKEDKKPSEEEKKKAADKAKADKLKADKVKVDKIKADKAKADKAKADKLKADKVKADKAKADKAKADKLKADKAEADKQKAGEQERTPRPSR
ncbi:Uncharacterised protein [Candidatus Gugararchaeum adminiculabundum]|nr:Uncharacterised protein [Candidatus Gugararchaeum adminiculabundum]